MALDRSRPASFNSAFRVGEFRALWLAQALSVVGDQLARVALSLLVFARTGSPALTALTYALTFLPDLIGGPLLSGLADRFPRKSIMVVADLARAVLVGVMALPGMPLVAIGVLLVVVQLLASPFNAARAAVLPVVLNGDRYIAGQSIINITYQTGQLAGYAGGGALVAFTGPNTALIIDAATFVASAVLTQFGLSQRPTPLIEDGPNATSRTTMRALRSGVQLVWRNHALRMLVALGCISGFYVVGEGLAVPYAHELGGGAFSAGLLFAAMPTGTALGMVMLTRFVPPATRLWLLGPLAVLSCAVLVGCAAKPNLIITLIIWTTSGIAAAFQAVAAAAFIRAVPDSGRGQAFGLANTSLRVAQGLTVVIAGAIAETFTPSWVVAVFGAAGALAALLIASAWHRVRQQLTVTSVEPPTQI